MVSATIRVSHMMPSPKRTPTKIEGRAPGRITRRNNSRRRHAVDAAHLDKLRIDGADAVLGIDVDRKEHAERDQEELRRLVDAEPEDDERDERQMRNVAHHLQRASRTSPRSAATARWRARRQSRCRRRWQSRSIARQKLTHMLRSSSPLFSSRQPAATTSVGAGRMRVERSPPETAACQAAMIRSGTIHCVRLPSRRSAKVRRLRAAPRVRRRRGVHARDG